MRPLPQWTWPFHRRSPMIWTPNHSTVEEGGHLLCTHSCSAVLQQSGRVGPAVACSNARQAAHTHLPVGGRGAGPIQQQTCSLPAQNHQQECTTANEIHRWEKEGRAHLPVHGGRGVGPVQQHQRRGRQRVPVAGSQRGTRAPPLQGGLQPRARPGREGVLPPHHLRVAVAGVALREGQGCVNCESCRAMSSETDPSVLAAGLWERGLRNGALTTGRQQPLTCRLTRGLHGNIGQYLSCTRGTSH